MQAHASVTTQRVKQSLSAAAPPTQFRSPLIPSPLPHPTAKPAHSMREKGWSKGAGCWAPGAEVHHDSNLSFSAPSSLTGRSKGRGTHRGDQGIALSVGRQAGLQKHSTCCPIPYCSHVQTSNTHAGRTSVSWAAATHVSAGPVSSPAGTGGSRRRRVHRPAAAPCPRSSRWRALPGPVGGWVGGRRRVGRVPGREAGARGAMQQMSFPSRAPSIHPPASVACLPLTAPLPLPAHRRRRSAAPAPPSTCCSPPRRCQSRQRRARARTFVTPGAW